MFIINTNSKLSNQKFTVEKVNDSKCLVKVENKNITLEISPISKKLEDGAYCFGIKQLRQTENPSMGVSLDSSFDNTVQFLEDLKDLVENQLFLLTGSVQKVAPLVWRSFLLNCNNEKVYDDERRILNMRLQYNQKKDK